MDIKWLQQQQQRRRRKFSSYYSSFHSYYSNSHPMQQQQQQRSTLHIILLLFRSLLLLLPPFHLSISLAACFPNIATCCHQDLSLSSSNREKEKCIIAQDRSCQLGSNILPSLAIGILRLFSPALSRLFNLLPPPST